MAGSKIKKEMNLNKDGNKNYKVLNTLKEPNQL